MCTSRVWICSFSSLFSSCSVFRAISSSGPKQWVIGQRAADQPSAACLATIFSTLFSDRPKGGAAHSRGSPLGQTHTTPAPHFTRRLRGWAFLFVLFLISGGGRQSQSPGFSGWAAKSNINCCILWVCVHWQHAYMNSAGFHFQVHLFVERRCHPTLIKTENSSATFLHFTYMLPEK